MLKRLILVLAVVVVAVGLVACSDDDYDDSAILEEVEALKEQNSDMALQVITLQQQIDEIVTPTDVVTQKELDDFGTSVAFAMTDLANVPVEQYSGRVTYDVDNPEERPLDEVLLGLQSQTDGVRRSLQTSQLDDQSAYLPRIAISELLRMGDELLASGKTIEGQLLYDVGLANFSLAVCGNLSVVLMKEWVPQTFFDYVLSAHGEEYQLLEVEDPKMIKLAYRSGGC